MQHDEWKRVLPRQSFFQARLRIHELKELFLKHEMMIVDIHVILALATRESIFQHRPLRNMSLVLAGH